MATAQNLHISEEDTRPQQKQPPAKTTPRPVPVKSGIFGPQGSGKSSTSALMAVAFSVLHCNRAPIGVVDPEGAWPFLKRRIFDVEGVELISRPYRSFKSMRSSIREFEKLGCCAWIADPITLHWNELMDTFKGKKGYVAIDDWADIRQLWGEYVLDFLNSPMTCIASGRLGNEFDEREEQDNRGNIRTKTVKVGTKFKAGGGESFGYEPHLLLEMSLERKAKRAKGQELEGEGRMVHRADVLKDRTWALNGLVMRWSDKAGYEKGGYSQVWNSLKPHFNEVQATMGHTIVGSDTSAELVTPDGNSEYYQKKQRKDVLSGELHATMEYLWGGTSGDAKKMRMKVFEHIFGFKSKEAAEAASLDKIERGVRILQAFEKRVKEAKETSIDLLAKDDDEILQVIDVEVAAYDKGEADTEDLPF